MTSYLIVICVMQTWHVRGPKCWQDWFPQVTTRNLIKMLGPHFEGLGMAEGYLLRTLPDDGGQYRTLVRCCENMQTWRAWHSQYGERHTSSSIVAFAAVPEATEGF